MSRFVPVALCRDTPTNPKAGASADERLLRSPRLPRPFQQKAFTCRRPLHCGALLRRHLNAFFIFPTGEKAMSLLDFFTGRSADELVQYEPTSEDTITFGLRLLTVGGLAAIAITILALRYFA